MAEIEGAGASGNVIRQPLVSVDIITKDPETGETTISGSAPASPLLPLDEEVLADGPTGYWRLNEKEGDTVVVDEQATYPGNYNGFDVCQGKLGAIYNDTNTGAQFWGGASSYIHCGRGMTPDTGDFAIEAWYKLGDPALQTSTIYGSDGFGNGWGWVLNMTTSAASFSVYTTVTSVGSTAATETADFSEDVWYHVVGVFEEGVGVYLYINGAQVAFSATLGTSVRTSTLGLLIGSSNSLGPSGYGTIDEVAAYDYRLPADRILVHYQAAIDQTYYNLVNNHASILGYWRLSESASHTTAADEQGVVDGTYTGTSTRSHAGAILKDDNKAFRGNTNGYVSIPYNAGQYDAAMGTEFSVEIWFRHWQTDLNKPLFCQSGTGLGFLLFFDATNGYLEWAWEQTSGGNFIAHNSGNEYADGKWHHVVASYKNKVGKLIVDGVLLGQGTSTNDINTHSNNFAIGAYNNSVGNDGSTFSGDMDEAAIYGAEITVTAALANFTEGRDGTYRDLMIHTDVWAYWRLGEQIGETVAQNVMQRYYNNAIDYINPTYQSGTTLETTGLLAGDTDDAVAFNGSTGYVLGTEPLYLLNHIYGTAIFSLGCWVQLNRLDVNQWLMANSDNDSNNRGFDVIFIAATNAVHIGIPRGFSGQYIVNMTSNSNAINDTNKHFVLITGDASNARIYVDGVLVGSGALGTPVGGNAAHVIEFGRRPIADADYLDGVLDEPVIWDKRIYEAEALEMYNKGA